MAIQLRGIAVLSLSLLLHAGTALASSPDAWEEFREDVQEKCLLALLPNESVTPIAVWVDPIGSESYGFSIIHIEDRQTEQRGLVACAYDKVTMEAEISSLAYP